MTLLTLMGNFADIIGILGAIFATLAWFNTRKIRQETTKERTRQNQKVKVILKNYDKNKTLELPVEMSRVEFSRAELLGRIGMIPTKNPKERFSINYFNSKEFFQQLDQVRSGSGNHDFVIPCTENEIGQFNIKK